MIEGIAFFKIKKLSFKHNNKTKVSLGRAVSDGGLWRTSSGGSGRLHPSIPASDTQLQIFLTFFLSLNSRPK